MVLLGFGEALHGGEEILILRNRVFQRLVERHGYSAIAIESSLPRSREANDYVSGSGPESYDAVREAGFSHGFGEPELWTMVARLAAAPGPGLLIPTHRGRGLSASEIEALPIRSGSAKNPTYFPLTPKSLADFDALAFLSVMGYSRGGPELP